MSTDSPPLATAGPLPETAPTLGSPRLLMVAGMMRSGTTLLQELCARDPDIRMTREFGMFEHLGEPFPSYVRHLRKRARRHYSYLEHDKKGWRRTFTAASFLARYIGFLPLGGWTVTTKSVQRSARFTQRAALFRCAAATAAFAAKPAANAALVASVAAGTDSAGRPVEPADLHRSSTAADAVAARKAAATLSASARGSTAGCRRYRVGHAL